MKSKYKKPLLISVAVLVLLGVAGVGIPWLIKKQEDRKKNMAEWAILDEIDDAFRDDYELSFAYFCNSLVGAEEEKARQWAKVHLAKGSPAFNKLSKLVKELDRLDKEIDGVREEEKMLKRKVRAETTRLYNRFSPKRKEIIESLFIKWFGPSLGFDFAEALNDYGELSVRFAEDVYESTGFDYGDFREMAKKKNYTSFVSDPADRLINRREQIYQEMETYFLSLNPPAAEFDIRRYVTSVLEGRVPDIYLWCVYVDRLADQADSLMLQARAKKEKEIRDRVLRERGIKIL